MNKRLMTLVTMMAVTGSILAAPAALASDTATQTQAGNTAQQQTQAQVKDQEETPIQTAVNEQFRFRGRRVAEGGSNGPNFEDKDGNGVCDNFSEEFLPERKIDGTGRNGDGQNFVDADKDGECDNLGEGPLMDRDRDRDKDQDGDGDKIQARQGKTVKPAAPQRKTDGTGRTGDGGQNYVDADKDGACDNLGSGTPAPKLDGSGNDGDGQNYVDSDDDGVCDNLGDGDQERDRLQDGTGSQTRQGARKGK